MGSVVVDGVNYRGAEPMGYSSPIDNFVDRYRQGRMRLAMSLPLTQ